MNITNATATLQSSSVDQTISIGQIIGSTAKTGAVICLIGELGTGKTHLAKGIATALGIAPEQISSPTYTLIAEHLNGNMPLYHMDAYRIEKLSELGPIGFDEYVSNCESILVIEWSDRIESALPVDRLELRLTTPDPINQPQKRSITLAAHGPRSAIQVNEIVGSHRSELAESQ